MALKLNTISFTSQYPQNRDKDAEKKIVTGGGAIAATTAAAQARATRSGLQMVKNATQITKTAGKVAKEGTTLWAKVCQNAKWAKDAIIGWGSKFKNLKFVKPIIESKAFRGCAGALGYGFGLVTLISGCSDIAKVATETIEQYK